MPHTRPNASQLGSTAHTQARPSGSPHKRSAPSAARVTLPVTPAPETEQRYASGRARAAGSAPEVTLVAVVVTLLGEEPSVRVMATADNGLSLPTAPYRLDAASSLDQALRDGVSSTIGLEFGHLEQLDCNALVDPASASNRLSIGYLALANLSDVPGAVSESAWKSWYAFFPWEDWRRGRPSILGELLEPRLRVWSETGGDDEAVGALTRLERVRMAFGLDGIGWDEERVVERLDLLERAGVMTDLAQELPPDHRRTLAVAIGRLRSRIKSRPVIFDLMPERFTLFELQRTVEAILGPHLHKQNFRRLVEHMGLVEPTDEIKSHTGGRPAKLFRFRQSVLHERLQPGVRVRTARG
jgi:hypothetical protein